MTPEKWQQTLGNILDNFEVEEHDKEFIDEQGGIDIEYIIFTSPLGKIRLEYTEKPVILDKKTTYSHRGGSDTGIEYIYSKTEKSQKINAYKLDESANEWVEIDSQGFA